MRTGRPCKYEARMKTISMRVPEDLYIMALGKARARVREDISFSELIRNLLEEYTGTVGFDPEQIDKELGIEWEPKE